MHTTLLSVLPTRPPRFVIDVVLDAIRRGGLFLLVLGLFGTYAERAPAQGSFPGVSTGASLNARVYPTDFWGPRVGPGIGVGLVGHNLLRRNDQWLVTAAPALHEQVGTLSFASANPQSASQYVLMDARGVHTDRDWFGPSSSAERTVLERSGIRARIRVGHTFFGQRLLLQPQLTLSADDVTTINGAGASSGRLGPVDGAALQTGAHTGLRAGGAVQFDTRNRPVLTVRGFLVQATWDRYVAIDASALHFDQVDFDAYGYVPLGGVHRLVFRGSATVTNALNSTPVPIYMLPTVGGASVPGWARGRFVGKDRIIASTLYRFPLRQYGNLVVIEGHVGLHAASVYEDVGDDFTTDVSFDGNLQPTDSRTPLRPSASAGIRLVTPFRQHTSVEFAVGVSPEGLSAVRFSFVRRLQSIRPTHHTSGNLR